MGNQLDRETRVWGMESGDEALSVPMLGSPSSAHPFATVFA
jgi:hypothetical protein